MQVGTIKLTSGEFQELQIGKGLAITYCQGNNCEAGNCNQWKPEKVSTGYLLL